jgi:hypothetical protein
VSLPLDLESDLVPHGDGEKAEEANGEECTEAEQEACSVACASVCWCEHREAVSEHRARQGKQSDETVPEAGAEAGEVLKGLRRLNCREENGGFHAAICVSAYQIRTLSIFVNVRLASERDD